MTECETCLFYSYDAETDEDLCLFPMDMDEAERLMTAYKRGCPFYKPGDDYTIVRKQN